jgi:hypothetical protein
MREGGLLGWSTDALVKLDDEVPGILSRVLTAAPARRQAIFAALAAHEVKAGVFDAGEDLFPMSFAEVIRHGRAVDILRMAFGDVPDGYPGLLQRIGERPLSPDDYLAIHQMLVRNDVRAADALRGSGRITRRKLEVLSSLDPRWHHANALERLDTGAEAITFNAAVVFIQTVCSRASDEAVAEAIARMRPTSTLPRLLDRFIRRADRLPVNPVPIGDNELRPLQTVRDYLQASRKYKNCLASKISHIAAGRMAVAEFRDECLVEFRPMTGGGGWMKWLCYGPRNRIVPISVENAAAAKCDALGIPRQDEDVGDSSGWRSYRAFTQELEWG